MRTNGGVVLAEHRNINALVGSVGLCNHTGKNTLHWLQWLACSPVTVRWRPSASVIAVFSEVTTALMDESAVSI